MKAPRPSERRLGALARQPLGLVTAKELLKDRYAAPRIHQESWWRPTSPRCRPRSIMQRQANPVLSVIVGSTREGRFSEKPAKWILQHLNKRRDVDARLLDLRDFAMPFFDQPATPATPGRPPYKNEVVQRLTAAIAQSDGFIFVTPEYNYRPSAVLKNAIDWVYPEWNRKAPIDRSLRMKTSP